VFLGGLAMIDLIAMIFPVVMMVLSVVVLVARHLPTSGCERVHRSYTTPYQGLVVIN
jgi:hypothetical protein